MGAANFKYVLLFFITVASLDVVNSQLAAIATRLPQIITLLDNVTDTSAIQTEIKDTLIQTAVTQTEMKDTLIQTAATQTEINDTLSQTAATQTEMKDILIRVANTQSEMANAFNQLVSLGQMQSQQLQNMTATMTNVVSLLENQIELQKRFRDCSDVAAQGYSVSKSYAITLKDGMTSFPVYCDMTTDGGGWTVFQRRFDGTVDFYLGWDEYVNGFGSTYGEYWLGLEHIHRLTLTGTFIVRIDLEDFEGNKTYAQYESFHVGDAASNYRLSIGSYSGTAGDSLTLHNNQAFSTKDSDHDSDLRRDCAEYYKGAWWYKACYYSNLNGLWLGEGQNTDTGMVWRHWKDLTVLKRSEMKMRQVY